MWGIKNGQLNENSSSEAKFLGGQEEQEDDW